MTFRLNLTDEQRARIRELRAGKKAWVDMIPCGPPCPSCGDNSYACDCRAIESKEQSE